MPFKKGEQDQEKQSQEKEKSFIQESISFLKGSEEISNKKDVDTEENESDLKGFFHFFISNWNSNNTVEEKNNKESNETDGLSSSKKNKSSKNQEILAKKRKENQKIEEIQEEKNNLKNIKSKGFFSKVKNIYSSYKKAQETQSLKYNIYDSIAQGGNLNKEFLVLLIGSCLITTIGLFQGSTAVIIGAMLIAPLMMPILSFALGAIWGDKRLLYRSFLTLLIGSIFVFTISSLLSYITPGVEFNSEISARINPNLYDILIALGSGLVGAYAFVNPKISSSLSGVAIAVALMPPLCTVGISVGQGNWKAAMGASLLYATNLVGISLSASFIFWRLKIHPVTDSELEVGSRAKRKVLFSSLLLVLISLPLGYFMIETYNHKQKEIAVKNILSIENNFKIISLNVKKFSNYHSVKGVFTVPISFNKTKKNQIEKDIRAIFNEQVKISLTPISTFRYK